MPARKKLGNILFATDLSEGSARAIEWLRWFHGIIGSTVHVIHVLNLFPFGLSAEEVAKARNAAAEGFDRFVRKHRLNRTAFAHQLVVGDPALTAAEYVANNDISLVVLGSQAVGLNRLLQGSISEEVFRSVACPVLTVGPRAKPPRSRGGISNIFFATNLVNQSKSVWPQIQFLFKSEPFPRVALAHFLPKENKSVVERYKTRKLVQAKLVKLVPENVRRQIDDVVVESCSPVKGILEFSRDTRSDLVVLGVKDAGPFTRAATHRPRSITHQVIQSTTCPVLTIRI